MNAGRELDALVAEKVMGWEKVRGPHLQWEVDEGLRTWFPTSFGSFQPSTDITAAMEVVDKMAAKNWNWMLQPGYATFAMTKDSGGSAFGASVQHAICLAALKAVGVKL